MVCIKLVVNCTVAKPLTKSDFLFLGYEKCADIRQSLGSGSDLVPSLKISNVRYFIVQVENCAHASDILRNGVWLVPNEIKQKIWNLREGKVLRLRTVGSWGIKTSISYPKFF